MSKADYGGKADYDANSTKADYGGKTNNYNIPWADPIVGDLDFLSAYLVLLLAGFFIFIFLVTPCKACSGK